MECYIFKEIFRNHGRLKVGNKKVIFVLILFYVVFYLFKIKIQI